MHHSHHPLFVVLSLLVAVFGSWTALDLFRRVRSHIGRTRAVWLGAAAVAMGVSIWSMHFIAMLGFNPGAPVSYDLYLTFLSLLLAIGATWGAFFAAAGDRAPKSRMFIAGAAMGAGICLMHYIGMAAVRTSIAMRYDFPLVAVSLIIAVTASTVAIFAASRDRSTAWRASAAVLLGAAIAGMHYTAMGALVILPGGLGAGQAGAAPLVLGISVAGGSVSILFMALLASLYDQRLNVLGALDAGGVGYWEMTLPDMTLHVSPKGKEIFGRDPQAPFGFEELTAALSSEERAEWDEELRRSIETGDEYNAEYRVIGEDGQSRWVNVKGKVVYEHSSRARRLIGVVSDVTERREAYARIAESERRQRVLIDELNHRVKNTLATVQSIARHTAKRAPSIEGFRENFEARLQALSQTHNALTRHGWERASLRELLSQELKPYSDAQVRLSGDDVELAPKQALALGLVFHELATNAAKYGALSATGGCVNIDWRVGDDRVLTLDWSERGGPPVQKPARKGFGSSLVQGSVAGELGGKAEMAFEPHGLDCRLEAPLPAAA